MHDWAQSRLGHGETICRRCLITNREAAVLGELNHCSASAIEARQGGNEVPPRSGESAVPQGDAQKGPGHDD